VVVVVGASQEATSNGLGDIVGVIVAVVAVSVAGFFVVAVTVAGDVVSLVGGSSAAWCWLV